MQVEIGALVHKDCGAAVLEAMRETEGVAAAMIEMGRSNDLFSNRQFGEYGEAAIITIIADEAHKGEVFNRLYAACNLFDQSQGLIFMTEPVIRSSL